MEGLCFKNMFYIILLLIILLLQKKVNILIFPFAKFIDTFLTWEISTANFKINRQVKMLFSADTIMHLLFQQLEHHQVLRKAARDPTFQRGLKRELKGLLYKSRTFCQSLTKAGSLCMRAVSDPTQEYCWQHGGACSVKRTRHRSRAEKEKDQFAEDMVDSHPENMDGQEEAAPKKTKKEKKYKKEKKHKKSKHEKKEKKTKRRHSVEEMVEEPTQSDLVAMFSSDKDKRVCRELEELEQIADSQSSYVIDTKNAALTRINDAAVALESFDHRNIRKAKKEKQYRQLQDNLFDARNDANEVERVLEIWSLDIQTLITLAKDGEVPHEAYMEFKKCMATGRTPYGDRYVKYAF
jgi:hypothetical protein